MSTWRLVPLGFCVAEVRNKNAGLREPNLLSLSYGNVVRRDIQSDEGLLPESFETYNVVSAGDTVLRLTDLQNDQRSLRVGLVRETGIITSAYVTLRPQHMLDPRFLNYYLKNLDFGKKFYALGAGVRQSLKFDELRRVPVPVPPLEVQRIIADYLDAETARIDALIEKKQRMVGLSTEKFSSQLSAVFDRVEGPRLALSVAVQIAEGQVDPRVEPYASMILLAPDHIESKTGTVLNTETAEIQGAVSGKYLARSGDVAYSKIRPSLRKACIVDQDCLCSADIYPLRPRVGLRSGFLLYFLLSDQFTSYAVMESERVAMPKINRDTFGRIRIPVPEISVQDAVVDELSRAAGQHSQVTSLLVEQVALLRERRQALIASAVTGGVKPPEVFA